MSHEFVKGSKFCVKCDQSAKFIASESPCWDDELETELATPAPEPAPQVWHLNVWTNVNGVLFTSAKTITNPPRTWSEAVAQAADQAVTDIILASTAAPEE